MRNNVFLAPMAGITDRPFRELCANFGAGFAASEMISSDTLLFATDKTRHRIVRAETPLPHAVQIAGADPDALAEAAALNVAHGADIIDINMGCPAKKVCNRQAGSALLAHPALVESILRAVTDRVDVPVTLKIRTGPNPAQRNAIEIAEIAERCGIACLAIHGRTRADKFRGNAEYDTIAAVKRAVGIPIIANGDITSGAHAVQVLEQTRADGVMIGRAAQGNPWLFTSITRHIAGLPEPDAPSRDEIARVLDWHLQALHALYGEYRGVRIARKHIAWYCRHQRNASAFRQHVNGIDCAETQRHRVQDFLERPERFAVAA